LCVRNALDGSEGTLERAETVDHRLSAGKLHRIRQATEIGDHLDQRLKGLSGFLQPQLSDTPARKNLSPPEAVGKELLAEPRP
jgi:hypothetical protein